MKLDKSPLKIQKMFNGIANKYDFINNIMSLGTQKLIKRHCIEILELNSELKILDLCCGTGDFAEIIKFKEPNSNILAIDFSENMLNIAKTKVKGVTFLLGDATNLPFPEDSFDVVAIGFGLRNIQNSEKAVEEIYRVLKSGGEFLHLDFGEKNILSKIFDIVILFFAKLFRNGSYEYLIKSKQTFLEPNDLIMDFESKGFVLEKRQDYIFKTISCQIMKKP